MRKMGYGIVAALAAASAAGADTLSFTLDTEFSGAVQPEGFITLTFEDMGANHVQLTIQGALGNGGQEKMTRLFINVDPKLTGPTTGTNFDMDIALNAGSSSGFDMGGVNKGVNSFRASGDGYYDVLFRFSNSRNTFNGDDKAVFDLRSGNSAFDVHSFDFLSKPHAPGNPGPFAAAAHVQGVAIGGTGSGGSGWVAPASTPVIPLPQPVVLAGAGLFALAGFRRR